MEIFTILYVLTLNYIATEAYERVGRAANCPKFTEGDFPGLRIRYRRQGTKAQFRCRKKFDRYGPKFATCRSDGTWSNEPPLCTKTGCVPLDPSQVTNLDMEVVNGAVVKFSCLNNYLLIGDTQAHCNGKDWSAPLPRCAAPHDCTIYPGHFVAELLRSLAPCWLPRSVCFRPVPIYRRRRCKAVILYRWKSGRPMASRQYFIEKQDEPFQISIVATRALSYISDIAIDDVRLHNCTKNTTSPPVTSSSSSSTTTTTSTSTSGTTTTTTVTTKITETSSPTSVVVETTTITKTPTETTIKKETTTTNSPEATVVNTSKSDTNKPVTTTTESTTVMKTSSLPDTSQTATSSTKAESSSKVTMGRQTSQSTPKPSFTETTMGKTRTMQPEMKTTPTRQATTQSTKKVKTPGPETTDTAGTPTIVSSSTTSSSTASTSSSTKSPITSTTVTSSTTSEKSSTPQPTQEQKTTTRSSSKTSSTSPTDSKQTSTSYEKTTVFSAKTSAPGNFSSTSKSTALTTTSSSFSSSSSSSSSSFSSSSSSSTSRFSSSSSSSLSSTSTSSYTKTANEKTGETKRPFTYIHNTTTTKGVTVTKADVTNTDTSGKTSKSAKSTKRTIEITTKSSDKPKGDKDNSITVSEGRSQHPEDDTLKPLMIGLGVGIVSGLIIIGVIAYVCVRRRKFYTSRHEDELKPITNSASLQSLNNGHFYQDEEYESES
ncbi:mucin-2-like [Ruditapes philippinarum]|uniref:mucin-2-like n=1 Tax=Ruditapes philippinarum TaxID=129788 RepID=UPI00295BF361|nr:mucin-2-like [Ruditapes philippinarum]